MCTLFFAAAKYNFWFVVSHLPGTGNVAADAISRNNLGVLFIHAPDINHTPFLFHRQFSRHLCLPKIGHQATG